MADARDCLVVRFTAPGGGTSMTMPAPADLRFDSEVPGGFKSLSCTVYLPAGSATPPPLVAYADVWVVDRRTGATVWYGALTDPGLSVGSDGHQTYSVTAEGPQNALDGWREVFGLVDRSSESWQAVGEFQGSQSSTGGDLTPTGDYNLDLGDFGDLIDFGDELSGDFGGSLDLGNLDTGDLDLGNLDLSGFNGDLGDFGGIDFTGADYPANADYPGYLGFLQDPFGNLGDQLPIPLGAAGVDGPFWAGWGPGWTDTGATATGTSVGLLTPGTVTPGPITRKRLAEPGQMMTPGYYDPGSPRGITPIGSQGLTTVVGVEAAFRLTSAASAVEVWLWADETLTWNGYVAVAKTTGLSLYRVDAGARTLLASSTLTLPLATLHYLSIGSNHGAAAIALAPLRYGLAASPLLSTTVLDSSHVDLGGGVTWTAPIVSGWTNVNTSTAGVPNHALLEGRFWGIGATGGPVEITAASATVYNT